MWNLRSFRFFWHPWHPWERLSSGDIWVLRFVLNILLTWRHLVEIFIFIKMIYHVSFIILVHQIVIFSLLISIKLIITKIHHLISLRFERSELKKSQCEALSIYNLMLKSIGKVTLLFCYFLDGCPDRNPFWHPCYTALVIVSSKLHTSDIKCTWTGSS